MCVNVAKLRGKIVERGLTQEKLALELSMDKALYPERCGRMLWIFLLEKCIELLRFLTSVRKRPVKFFCPRIRIYANSRTHNYMRDPPIREAGRREDG